MQAAVLRLESFDQGPVVPVAPGFTRADLDAAYERGRADGAAAARDGALADLTARLASFDASVQQMAAQRASVAADVIDALVPVLQAFADGALPDLAQARLQAGLRSELERLASGANPLVGVIRCGPDQQAFVQQCLDRLGSAGIALDATGPEATVELSLDGGRVVFDQAALAGGFRALIGELMDGAQA